MFRLSFLLIFIIVIQVSELKGQPQESNSISSMELRLMKLYSQIEPATVSPHRQDITMSITELWKEILNRSESFFYPFDSLRFVGKVFSTDSLIRVYTWNFPRLDGTHEYYGFIQSRPVEGRKQLVAALRQGRESLEGSENKVFTADEWYGALYYEIIPFSLNNSTVYLLLGLDLNDFFTNRKVVDVMKIAGDQVLLGAPVFLIGRQVQNRVIFEYSSRAVMSLRYDYNRNMIIHDHLSPSQPRYRGQYRFYGPDFSFDGFVFEKNRWRQVIDIDISN